jgi:hypothetical protein
VLCFERLNQKSIDAGCVTGGPQFLTVNKSNGQANMLLLRSEERSARYVFTLFWFVWLLTQEVYAGSLIRHIDVPDCFEGNQINHLNCAGFRSHAFNGNESVPVIRGQHYTV